MTKRSSPCQQWVTRILVSFADRLTDLRLTASVLMLAGLLTGCVHYEPRPIEPARVAAGLEARTLDAAELRAFLETNLHDAPLQWPLRSWDLERLTLAAFYYHPSLEIARVQWATTRAGEKTAGGRPNPTLSISPEYAFNADRSVSPWIAAIHLDWPIETGSKRERRIEKAERLSEVSRLNLALAAWQVRSQLRDAVLEHAAAARREQLLRAGVAMQEKIVGRQESKVRAGAIAAYEVAPARLALGRLRVEAGAAVQLAAESRARIAEAIGVPAAALTDKEFVLPLNPPDTADITSSEARRQALLGRADVLAALASYAAAEADLRLQIAKQYPDVHVGTGYQFDQGEHKWSLGLSGELPVLNRNQGPITEAFAARNESAARFTAVQAKVIASIDRALASLQSAQNQLAALRPLRAAQQQQADAVAAQARAGAAEPLDLLAAQAELAAADVTEFDARLRVLQALGQLEDAVQRPFDALRVIEQSPAPQAATPSP